MSPVRAAAQSMEWAGRIAIRVRKFESNDQPLLGLLCGVQTTLRLTFK
jgi:hypothetical protein